MKNLKNALLLLTAVLVLSSCAAPKPETTEVPTAASTTEVASPDASAENESSTLTVFQQMEKDALARVTGFVAPTDKNIRIGVLMITMANPFWVTFADGIQAKANELGITVDIQSAPTEGDIASQLATCETMVSADYDTLVIYPITENNLIPCITKATAAGIPILEPNVVSDIAAIKAEGGKLIQVKTLDFVNQGAIGAQYIVDKLGDVGGKVAIIEGLAAAPQSMDRRDGAKAVFEKSKNITLVTSQTGDWDRTVALNAATNIIQANPDIRGFYCANDVMALAVQEAVIAAGKTGQVFVVGTDFIEDAKTSIRNGELAGSAAFSPYVWGEVSIELAILAAEGKTVPEVYLPNVLVNIDNVNNMTDWK